MTESLKKEIGEQVYLRPLTTEDTEMVVAWRNSKRVMDNFIYQTPITTEGHLNWFHNKVETGEVIDFVICDNETDQPYGCIYLQNIEMEHRRAEWGIFLGEPAAFGRGIGKEAAKLLVKYGFEQMNLHKITSKVLPFNIPSIKMNEAAGYKQEAYLKDEVLINGVFQDLILFGVINEKDVTN